MLKLFMIVLVATPGVAAAAAEKTPKPERRICRRDTSTGSLVQAKRTCLTKEEWAQSKQHSKQTVKEWQDAIDGAQRAN